MSDYLPTVNRMVVVVSPKAPYREWARSLDDDEPTIDMITEEDLTMAFLVEENDDPERSLEQHWESMFEEQLNSWSSLPEEWRRGRTYQMFEEWFEFQVVDLVLDLGKGSIRRKG